MIICVKIYKTLIIFQEDPELLFKNNNFWIFLLQICRYLDYHQIQTIRGAEIHRIVVKYVKPLLTAGNIKAF